MNRCIFTTTEQPDVYRCVGCNRIVTTKVLPIVARCRVVQGEAASSNFSIQADKIPVTPRQSQSKSGCC